MKLRVGWFLLWVVIVLIIGPRPALFGADFWKNKKPSEWSQSDARQILRQSPWVKRAKLRSTISGDPNNLPALPGTEVRRAGVIGPNGTALSPSTSEVIDRQLAGNQTIPCLGWGAGSMGSSNLPSPTSDECKAAWRSVSAVTGESSLEGSVVVLWESATPIRDAKTKLGIDDPVNVQAASAFIVSMIGYPLMIDPSQGAMKPVIRDSAVLLRKGNNAMHASDVAFIESGSTIIRFYFQGKNTIKPGDRELVFRFQMEGNLVEAKFDLKQMTFQGEPAL